jgi:1-acyl-sn-glycerol-3-phosphate acyltransferase
LFYAFVTRVVLAPLSIWGRMRVTGAECVPEHGPVLLVPNHDSQMDPLLVALALRGRRALRFLGRANLWRVPGLAPILHGLRQIPIERGKGDIDALWAATAALREGEAICIFPEGRLSMGERLRAHSGVARLRETCPQATVVLCAVSGATDYVRFPRRPRVGVDFFMPGAQDATPEELLAALRERVPPTPAGR